MKVNKLIRTRCECDYCGKKNWSVAAMKKHELHCTKNPNRICGICEMIGKPTVLLIDLIDKLPIPIISGGENGSIEYINIEEINLAIKEITKLSNSCPACVLSALRQKPIKIIDDIEFNYKDLWNQIKPEIDDYDYKHYYGL